MQMKRVSVCVVAAAALQTASAQQQNDIMAHMANMHQQMFGGAAAQPAPQAAPGTDPFSQMMQHAHNTFFGGANQQQAAGGAAAQDPFKMMNDMATQANQHFNQHFTNAHQAMTDMSNQANEAFKQGHQAMNQMMTPQALNANTDVPLSRSCPTTIECFSEHNLPGLSCSGVQGGANCIGGKMFPWPQSGVCSCNDPAQVCSPKANPSFTSVALCSAPSLANKAGGQAVMPHVPAGPVPNGTLSIAGSATKAGQQQQVVAASPGMTCSGRCNGGYDPTVLCQCNGQCAKHSNCCPDITSLCGIQGGMPVTTSPAPVVVGGTTPANPLGTTMQPNAFGWFPGFAPLNGNSRLYDADVHVTTTREGPSSKLLMACTLCLFAYAVVGFAALRAVSFVRRQVGGSSSSREAGSWAAAEALDAELALDAPLSAVE
eukprot:TRINITY_DN1447_c0_g2_i1.p2 TRINITY_DN1447_c0_g2~~TRINITY_DN1447_c0_g2_i1.p2  ORF type:complete len:430 (+),score=114.00 TRINITY_DN1447_c0_g2_i1:104-1393(+)